jgi:serine protease Do
MGTGIFYRHNIMNIDSMETFANVKGGFLNNQRDVYFVREIGESADFLARVQKMDRQMDEKISVGHLKYKRIKKLPGIKTTEESLRYANMYEQWNRNKTLHLNNGKTNQRFEEILSNAYREVLEKYKNSRITISESMLRNFAVKILYWFDMEMRDVLQGWTEKSCIKVVAENVEKEQEYLFYYFLTLVGCDVLLLQNKKDVKTTEKIQKLSVVFQTGPFGNTELPKYVPGVRKKQETKVLPKPEKNVQGYKTERMREKEPVTKISIPEKQEKTFEELAQLAASIVMIAIHDNHGEVLGTGSGIMIGKDGYILTNNHVASGGSFYSVRIEEDEKIYLTKDVVKYHPELDLAIIKIDRKLNPLAIYQGKKKLVRGQKVVAIGSPLGLFNSVSDGIISGFRKIENVNMIQFTAPISHGSSGGAVLNMQGEVIGISSAGIDKGQNINLAVGYEDILLFARGFFK